MSLTSWMFKQRMPEKARSVSGFDMLIILATFMVVQWVYLHTLELTTERSVLLFSVLLFSYATFAAFGLYRSSSTEFMHQLIMRLTVAWFIVGLLAAFVLFLSKAAYDVSRVWFSVSMISSYIILVGVRLVSSAFLAKTRMQGRNIQLAVLISDKDQNSEILQRLQDNPWTGYRVARVFSNNWSEITDAAELDAEINKIHEYVEQQRTAGSPIVEVWIRLPLSAEKLIKRISSRLQDSSVDVCLLPDAFAMQVFSGTATNVAELPVINISDIKLPVSAELFKRIFDRLFSLVAVLFLSPLMLLIAISIKIDSRGPVLFRQLRYGMDGREIEVWKFRSMKVLENGNDVKQATKGDPRVTRLGALLRKTSLDELPQFINVLQGRMSIVGPRPHAVLHNEEYRGQIDGYMLRHKIKPGITGWAQVNGWRGETDTLDKMRGRVEYDLEYIQNWSAWLDIKIVAMTVYSIFAGQEAY